MRSLVRFENKLKLPVQMLFPITTLALYVVVNSEVVGVAPD
jgi:hypothetical protein